MHSHCIYEHAFKVRAGKRKKEQNRRRARLKYVAAAILFFILYTPNYYTQVDCNILWALLLQVFRKITGPQKKKTITLDFLLNKTIRLKKKTMFFGTSGNRKIWILLKTIKMYIMYTYTMIYYHRRFVACIDQRNYNNYVTCGGSIPICNLVAYGDRGRVGGGGCSVYYNILTYAEQYIRLTAFIAEDKKKIKNITTLFSGRGAGNFILHARVYTYKGTVFVSREHYNIIQFVHNMWTDNVTRRRKRTAYIYSMF